MSDRIVGFVVPPAAGHVPPEARELYPTGIEFLAEGLGIADVSPASFDVALARLPDAIARLLDRGAEAISMMGTSISFYRGWEGHARLIERMHQAAGAAPISTMANAIVGALKAQRAARIAVGSAYRTELSQALVAFLTGAGFEVLGERHMALANLDAIHTTGTAALVELGDTLLTAYPAAEALLISCGGLRTIEATTMLEARYHRPVVSSAIAGCHDAVRLLQTVPAATLGGGA